MTDLPEDVTRLVPAAYVAALESVAAGGSDDDVAARTGVDPAAARTVVQLAVAKLLDAITPR